MKKISFVHTADLHLGSPFLGLESLPKSIFEKIRDAAFQSFSRIVDLAIGRRADFVLVAGDVYDGEDRDVRSQLYFRKEMERLRGEGIPVFVIHGNHDHLNGNWLKVEMPDNVHIFSGKVETKLLETGNGARVHLYGFSYPARHVPEPMAAGYQKKEGAHYHIGLLHGHDGKNPNHYVYAPFSVDELLEKGFDYWALGHIHQRAVLHRDPYVVYPGNIQGRNRKETGEKGCYFVEMDPSGTSLEFVPTAPVLWLREKAEREFRTVDELYDFLAERKEHHRRRGVSAFLQLDLDRHRLSDSVAAAAEGGDLLKALQEGEADEHCFVWIHSLRVREEFPDLSPLAGEPFFRQLKKEGEIFDIDAALAPLLYHPAARRYLDPLTAEEKEEIMKEAEGWIASFFRSGGKF
ncbi:MAG: hypothetical protein CW346_03465 [Bacillaceae bacterium]|nr:hypothetical protein [Bacillaceae bacterium]